MDYRNWTWLKKYDTQLLLNRQNLNMFCDTDKTQHS